MSCIRCDECMSGHFRFYFVPFSARKRVLACTLKLKTPQTGNCTELQLSPRVRVLQPLSPAAPTSSKRPRVVLRSLLLASLRSPRGACRTARRLAPLVPRC